MGGDGMTISDFANEHRQMDDWLHVPVRRAYREQKRREAENRQATYAALVANGPDDVRQYRNRAVRPRLGRKMREVAA